MSKRMIPQDVILRRIAQIDQRIEELNGLRLQRDALHELLQESVEVDDPENENQTLTDQIINLIHQNPGNSSGDIAQHLVKAGVATNVKTVQTIIGQLVKRQDAPIVRKEGGKLFPPAPPPPRTSGNFEDFPGVLEDEDDDLPF